MSMSVFSFAFSTSAAYGQTAQLAEVFVTANRTGQPLNSVLSEVDILEKSDLENSGNANLTQALSKLPGFQSISYGTNSVYLRGTESRMTAVYIEGIRIESQDGLRLGGGVPWEMLPLEMVDRMEVLKGPASAMYGSDAMGGVVQLFGKKASVDDRPSVTQSFGSYGLKQTTGQLSGKKEAFDYALLLSTSSSDGYDTRPDLLHTPSKEANSKDMGMLKLGYDVGNSDRLESVWLSTRQSYKTAPTAYSGGPVDITNRNHIVANGVHWQHGWDEHNNSRIRFNVSEVAVDSDAPNSDPTNFLADLPWKYKTTATTLSFDHEYIMRHSAVTALLEKKQDQFQADANEYPWLGGLANAAVDASRSQIAIGIGYNLSVDGHTLNTSVRSDDYSNFSRHNSCSLTYGYEVSPHWVLSAGQSTGFKAPTLEQMYGLYGNISLLPETNVSKEMALLYSNGSSKARMTLFENGISNLISSSSTVTNCAYGQFCYYNVGRVNIQGISVSGQTKMGDVNMQASIDFMNPTDQIKQKQLSLRSKQNMRIAADQSIDNIRAGMEFQYVGKRFDDADNTVEFPAYHLINIWFRTALSSEWSWLNRIDNLFNKKYQQYGCTSSGVNTCNYAMPGVTLFTFIQWQPK